MNPDMLVEIYASFPNKNSIATGWAVAPNRILTARHALYSGSGKAATSIEIRWFYKKDDPKFNWMPAMLVQWNKHTKLDVALLECEFPEGIDHGCYFEASNPKKSFKWESQGFARVGKHHDYRNPTPIQGETQVMKEQSSIHWGQWMSGV